MAQAEKTRSATPDRSQDYTRLAESVIAAARAQGAQDATVLVHSVRQIAVDYCDGRVEKLQETVEQSLNLDIYADGRFSQHATSNLATGALQHFVTDAVAMTRFLAPDPFRALPGPELVAYDRSLPLDIDDPAYARTEAAAVVALAASVEQAARGADPAVVSATTSAEVSRSQAVRLTSNGFWGCTGGTFFGLGAEVTVSDRRGALPEDWSFALARHLADLPDAAGIGRDAARRAQAKIGQKKLPSGRYAVVIENRAAGQLLNMLLAPLRGRALQQKSSCLEGRLGEPIASTVLTCHDDPFLQRGLRSRHFDGDGIGAARRQIIDQGVLRAYYIDHYYGRKLGLEPNADGPSNLLLPPGSRPAAAMVQGLANGVFITGLLGGNFNATTGDFSFGIMGLAIRDGEAAHGINEMNLSGNLLSFWHGLAELGSDPFPYGAARTPALYFPDIELSGL
jgi:PmbA protein